MKEQGSGVRDQGSGGGPLRGWLPIGPAVILVAAMVAVAPLLVRGDSCGHDFDFHLVSWFDALNSWRHGIVYPHWTASANYGAGEPRFVFYSPLTWMMGAALGIVLPWTLVPVALTFLLLAGTGLAVRALGREALGEGAATLAGCVALYSGYALFTAYERTAFAELAGGVWIPLVLLYALRRSRSSDSDSQAGKQCCDLKEQSEEQTSGAKAHIDSVGLIPGLKSRPTVRTELSSLALLIRGRSCEFDGSVVLLALAVAGAWLSNPTVGVMACYLLAAVVLVRLLVERSWKPLLRASAGAALGMGLIAIYLVPAAYEQRWVDIHQVTEDPEQTLENNWLFAVHADPQMAIHDRVLHTASMIAVAMIAVAVVGLLVCWLRGRLPGARGWWVPLAVVPFAVLLLQFPVSHLVWNMLPEVRFLQFPWRWLVVLEAPMAIFVAAAVWPGAAERNWRRVAVGLAAAAVFAVMTAWAARDLFQVCDVEDSADSMASVYRAGAGFIGTYEYEPMGADNSEVARGLPLACLVSDPAIKLGQDAKTPDAPPEWNAGQGSCEATFKAAQDLGPEHLRIAGTMEHAGYLVLRLRSYPAWDVRVNGRAVSALPMREDGLMAVAVPEGQVNVTADWKTTTDVVVSRWLSGLSALLLVGLCMVERRSRGARLS